MDLQPVGHAGNEIDFAFLRHRLIKFDGIVNQPANVEIDEVVARQTRFRFGYSQQPFEQRQGPICLGQDITKGSPVIAGVFRGSQRQLDPPLQPG